MGSEERRVYTMTVTVEKQPIYMGGGLTRVYWVIRDGGRIVGWDTDYAAAHQQVDNKVEQQEHRDGE